MVIFCWVVFEGYFLLLEIRIRRTQKKVKTCETEQQNPVVDSGVIIYADTEDMKDIFLPFLN